MNLTAFQYYPLGFRSPTRDGFRTETIADPVWVQHYADFKNGKISGESMEFRLRTIEIARRLFGNFNDWLDAQDQNTKISDQAYDLLKDTIAYLNTGRRPISLSTRVGIMADQIAHGQYGNPKAVNRRDRLRDNLKISRGDFLFHWVQPKDGFADLVQTLDILFGQHREQ